MMTLVQRNEANWPRAKMHTDILWTGQRSHSAVVQCILGTLATQRWR